MDDKKELPKSSVKDKLFLKSDNPVNTVNWINKGFSKLGIHFDYKLNHIEDTDIYWSTLYSKLTGFHSSGKGSTPELAKASAYAEMVERFSARLHFYNFLYLTQKDNKSINLKNFLNFNYLPGYVYGSEENISNAISINSLFINSPIKKSLNKIKNADISKHWVDGFSLIHNINVKVPIKLIKRISISSGLAAGNTIEEAIVHASNEIFERFIFRMILKQKDKIPTFNIDSIKNKSIIEMIKYYNKIGFKIILKDFSCNGLFPCIGVLFIKKNNLKEKPYIHVNIGVSFNPEEALTRVLIEFHQSPFNLDKYYLVNKKIYGWFSYNKLGNVLLKKSSLVSGRYVSTRDLTFLEDGDLININDFPYKETFDFCRDIEEIKKICKLINSDLIVINQTHPIINFPVVRVVIPGYSDMLDYFYHIDPYGVINTNFPYDKGPIFNRFFNDKYWKKQKTKDKLLDEIKKLVKKDPNQFQKQINRDKLCNNHISIKELLLYLYIQKKDFNNFKLILSVLSEKEDMKKRQNYYLRLFNLGQFNRLKNKIKEDHLLKTIDIMSDNPFNCYQNKSQDKSYDKNIIKSLNSIIRTFSDKRI